MLQPPSPTGHFQFTNMLTAAERRRDAGGEHGQQLRVVSARPGAEFQHRRAAAKCSQPRATIAEFFVQDDWRATPRLSLNLGVRYTLNFPSTVEATTVARCSISTRSSSTSSGRTAFRALRELWKAATSGRASGWRGRRRDSLGDPRRLRPDLDRAGRHHDAVHDAAVPVHPHAVGSSRSTTSTRRLCFRKGRRSRSTPPDADSGLGQGVFGVQRDKERVRAAMESVAAEDFRLERWSFEAGYLGSKLTRLGVPDVNLNQLPRGRAGAWARSSRKQVPNPYFGEIPANPLAGRADHRAAAIAAAAIRDSPR